jgi:hypothetical protein
MRCCTRVCRGVQVQNLVQRNEALQRELSELRVALDVAKRGEEELVRKNHLCEKTIETLVGRAG